MTVAVPCVLHPVRAPGALLVAALGALAGCAGDHDYLAQKNVDAGALIDATIADLGGDERRIVAPPADGSEASIGDRIDVREPPEPPGRWTFTLTNGLVDVASARFCFVPVVGDKEMRDRVVLDPAGGLAFGKSVVLGELRGIDLSTMGIHPYAVIGAGTDGGTDCAAILEAQDGAVEDDGAARGPVAISLPFIPAGTLVEGRSYLGVVNGCARRWPFADAEAGADAGEGGDGEGDDAGAIDAADGSDAADGGPIDAATMDVFRPPARAAICGASTGVPNAGLVLVRLSRRDVGGRFGFQAVHASMAVAGAQVAIERAGSAAPIFSAVLGPYQIAPRDGLTAVTRDDFGPSIGAATVRIASPVSAFPALVISLAAMLSASDIDEAGLVEGDLLSLVLIGAQPGQNPGPPWNGAHVAVVRNAPATGRD